MKVKDCMTRESITVNRSTTLTQLIKLFQQYNFHTFPVTESDGRLVGIIDFEDLLKVFQPYSSELHDMLKTVPFLEADPFEESDLLLADISGDMGALVVVDDLMRRQFVTVDADMDINQARTVMKLHNSARLPVVKEERLIGIVSLFDIILAVFREKGIIK